MSSEVLVALITSGCTLLGVIVTSFVSTKKQGNKINDSNKKVGEYASITLHRIEQLEKKQDKHNSLMERVFILEGQVGELAKEMKSVRSHIINDSN